MIKLLLSVILSIASLEAIGQEPDYLAFYKTGHTEFLGNFAHCLNGVEYLGHHFRNSEAAFQWTKFYLAAQENQREDMLLDPEMDQFFEASGEDAFRLRQKLDLKYTGTYSKSWLQGLRDQVMWEILVAKFEQNPDYAGRLLATAPDYLLEHNEREGRDTYWSDDYTGNGLNMLGKMLMALRDHLPCPKSHDDSDRMERIQYAEDFNQTHPYPIW
jgi:predicted NAD-dependent protein-ADP-ribosyltransferase YbiA (DUF1768 family)